MARRSLDGSRWCLSFVYPLVISHSYGKSLFSMGKSTISMAIFNSYVSHNQRVIMFNPETTNAVA